ncbi:hypothetical protein EDM56_13080 [Brevibacillus fluminis]|uniref:Uncharacterized protein n=1 Tax=Brevibacillus fluminis TaxID=511487 RepID=A0A3M8DIA6_9BACL|nr:hypothetical protein [Brevibacillus fluminis]RNB87764.1 hypothetical protein EDM56_13080 [Brevibacillus fluminis]
MLECDILFCERLVYFGKKKRGYKQCFQKDAMDVIGNLSAAVSGARGFVPIAGLILRIRNRKKPRNQADISQQHMMCGTTSRHVMKALRNSRRAFSFSSTVDVGRDGDSSFSMRGHLHQDERISSFHVDKSFS